MRERVAFADREDSFMKDYTIERLEETSLNLPWF